MRTYVYARARVSAVSGVHDVDTRAARRQAAQGNFALPRTPRKTIPARPRTPPQVRGSAAFWALELIICAVILLGYGTHAAALPLYMVGVTA